MRVFSESDLFFSYSSLAIRKSSVSLKTKTFQLVIDLDQTTNDPNSPDYVDAGQFTAGDDANRRSLDSGFAFR